MLTLSTLFPVGALLCGLSRTPAAKNGHTLERYLYTVHTILVSIPITLSCIKTYATVYWVTVKGPYLPSVSPAIEKRRKTHTATTFSCIIIVYVRVLFWFESCLGNTLFDTIMQGILYLCPKDYSEVMPDSHVYSIALNEYCGWVQGN